MMVFFRNLTISGSPPLKSVLPLIADSGQNNSQSPTSQSSISISTDEKNVTHAGTRGEVQEKDEIPCDENLQEGLPEALGCLKVRIYFAVQRQLLTCLMSLPLSPHHY